MDKTEDYRARLYKNYRANHLANRPGSASARVGYDARLYAAHFGDLLPPDKAARILEIGSGAGAFMKFLHDAGYKNAQGIEQDPDHITESQEAGIQDVEQGDALETLGKTESSYDCIVAIDFLEHFRKEEIFPIADLLKKALKPGGTVVGRVPNADGFTSGRIRYGDLTHELAFTRSSLWQLFQTAGFQNVEVFPEEPVVTGLTSLLRWLLWQPMSLLARLYLFAESYAHADAQLTPNILFRASLGRSKSSTGTDLH